MSEVARDDLGTELVLRHPPRRVVSLVPSLSESLARSAPGLLVGATDWCVHPADLDVPQVGGTKWPDVERVLALAPDLVLANEEENRAEDVQRLRAAGVAVWVTAPRTVPSAITSLRRMLAVCGAQLAGADPSWLSDAEHAWQAVRPGKRRTAIVPIWRRPWMVLGRDTFAGDVLLRLGVANAYAAAATRYPKVPLDELRARPIDLVVLPDEPYAFSAADGPESFPGRPVALVSGRHLTWYGPSLAEAPEVLGRQLSV